MMLTLDLVLKMNCQEHSRKVDCGLVNSSIQQTAMRTSLIFTSNNRLIQFTGLLWIANFLFNTFIKCKSILAARWCVTLWTCWTVSNYSISLSVVKNTNKVDSTITTRIFEGKRTVV